MQQTLSVVLVVHSDSVFRTHLDHMRTSFHGRVRVFVFMNKWGTWGTRLKEKGSIIYNNSLFICWHWFYEIIRMGNSFTHLVSLNYIWKHLVSASIWSGPWITLDVNLHFTASCPFRYICSVHENRFKAPLGTRKSFQSTAPLNSVWQSSYKNMHPLHLWSDHFECVQLRGNLKDLKLCI